MDIFLKQEKRQISQGKKHPLPDDLKHFIAEFSWIAVGTVDVDASLLAFNSTGKLLETISFTHPQSEDGSINHHGDMSTRVAEYESRKEFERIEIDLNKTHEKLHTLVLVVSCHKGSFAKLTALELTLLQIEKVRSETQEKCIIHSSVDERYIGEQEKWTAAILGDLSRQTVADNHGEDPSENNGSKWELCLGTQEGVVVGYAKNADQAGPYVYQYLAISQPHMVPKKKGKSYFIHRVYDIALKLGPADLTKLGPLFPEQGLAPKEFVEVLLQYFCEKFPELRDLESATHVVALLQDLFGQIDIQGDGYIGFDEFTDFCVDASNVHTGGELPKCQADEEVDYTCQTHFGDGRQRSKVLLMRTSSSSEKFLVVREHIPQVQLVDKVTGMVDLALDCATHTVSLGRNPIHPLEKVREMTDTVAMDAIFLPAKKAIAITATNHHISIWNYVPQNRASAKYLYCLRARIVQTQIHWAPNKDYKGKEGHVPGYIFSVGVDNVISIWDPETRAITQTIHDHPELVNDIIYNRRHGLLMTAGFDRRVRIFEWDKKMNRYVSATIFKERSPLKLLGCDSDTLCAVSLECEATCYSLTLRKPTCRLVGHQATIIGVRIATFIDGNLGIQTRAITCDAMGEVRIWNLSSFNNKEGSADAFFIQQMPPKGSYQCSMLMGPRYRGEEIWPDIVISGLGFPMGLIQAVKAKTGQLEATCLRFNEIAEAIIGAVGHKVMVWDANTSRKTKTFEMPNRSDVTALAFDHKLQRRLFAGNMNGDIAVFNYVTCRVVNSLKVHEGSVTGLRYCSITMTLISTSLDKHLLVLRDDLSGNGDRYITRQVRNAHDMGVIALDYSEELFVMVTASKQCVRFWSFEDLKLLGQISKLEAEVVAVSFIPGYPLLACTDASGVVNIISVHPCPTPNTIVAQLTLPNANTRDEGTQDGNESSHSASGLVQCLTTIVSSSHHDENLDDDQPHSSTAEFRTKTLLGGTSKGDVILWPMDDVCGALENQFLYIPQSKEDKLHPDMLSVVCKRDGKQILHHDYFQEEGEPQKNAVSAKLFWAAHKDAVLAIAAMQNVGLLVSSSGHGKIKMWTAYGCELDYDVKEAGACLGTIGLTDKESKKLERESLWKCPALTEGRHQADEDRLQAVAKLVLRRVEKGLKKKAVKKAQISARIPEEGDKDESGNYVGLPQIPHAVAVEEMAATKPEDFPEVQRLLRRQRQALHTSHQAKDPHGKVLYGNMYTQLHTGKALTIGSSSNNRHPQRRGSSKLKHVDVSPSPFLQEKLPDIHSSVTNIYSPIRVGDAEGKRRCKVRRRERLRHGEMSGSKSAPILPKQRMQISSEIEVMEGSFFVTQQGGKNGVHMTKMERKMEATLQTLDEFLAEKNWGVEKDGVFLETTETVKESNHDKLSKLQDKFDRAIKTPLQPGPKIHESSKKKIKPRITLIERQSKQKANKENRQHRQKIMCPKKEGGRDAEESAGAPGGHRRRSLYGGKYTRVQINNVAQVFHQMDKSGDNVISYDEFETFVASNTKESQIFRTLHFSMLDPDNSGDISLNEITQMLFCDATPKEIRKIKAIIQHEMREMRKKEEAKINNKYGEKVKSFIGVGQISKGLDESRKK